MTAGGEARMTAKGRVVGRDEGQRGVLPAVDFFHGRGIRAAFFCFCKKKLDFCDKNQYTGSLFLKIKSAGATVCPKNAVFDGVSGRRRQHRFKEK